VNTWEARAESLPAEEDDGTGEEADEGAEHEASEPRQTAVHKKVNRLKFIFLK
jgi:hypothetical protein